MTRFMYQAICLMLLGVLAGWVGYLETVRHMQLEEITDAWRINQQEWGNVLATQQAQAQAEPLMAMVEELAAQNTAYIKVVDEARRIVTEKNEEAARDKAAINHSVELLRQASVEHNRSIDHIRRLERFIDQLMQKIPENARPAVPRLNEKLPKPRKWSQT